MSCQTILIAKIKKTRNEFRQSYANKTALDVYDDWYKIHFYEAYYDLLISDYADVRLDDKVVKWLCQFYAPLDFLYGEWLKCDVSSIDDWEVMIDWLINLYHEDEETNLI